MYNINSGFSVKASLKLAEVQDSVWWPWPNIRSWSNVITAGSQSHKIRMQSYIYDIYAVFKPYGQI